MDLPNPDRTPADRGGDWRERIAPLAAGLTVALSTAAAWLRRAMVAQGLIGGRPRRFDARAAVGGAGRSATARAAGLRMLAAAGLVVPPRRIRPAPPAAVRPPVTRRRVADPVAQPSAAGPLGAKAQTARAVAAGRKPTPPRVRRRAARPRRAPAGRPPAVRAAYGAARFAAASVAGIAGVVALAFFVSALAPPALSSAAEVLDVELNIPEDASLPALDERSAVYDADGRLMAVIDREVSRRTVPLRKIPKHARNAVITAEDRKFWEHDGYDVEGIGRAVVANVRARGVAEGGSTITQQLAKTEVGDQVTLQRKAAELLYAVALEDRFSKTELLERYLNQVYFGSRAYGIVAASEEFFDTHPGKLTVDQSALLASLIRSPNSGDPRERPRLARRRRNLVLRAMAEEGYVKPERLPQLLRRPLGVVETSPKRKRRQPHVIDAVERELLTLEELGKTRKQRQNRLYYGGLRIQTTLDSRMQQAAEETIRSFLPGGAPTGAIATVEPATGAIRAIQSGLQYKDLKYDLATQGRRQPGSAFKPFVYAEALREGFPLEMTLEGKSPAYFPGVRDWERNPGDPDAGVENYGGASYGRLDMRSALTNSVNTAAAQLMLIVGPKKVSKLASEMGIDMKAANRKQVNPGIVLGGFYRGTTPLEMASAYSVFANEGKHVRPHLIERIKDRQGKVLYEFSDKPERVFPKVVNAAVVDLMRDVVTSGTGTGAALPSWEVAGKTGTTTDNKDAWFVGYTPVLSTAVWMGHANAGIAMPGMTGGSLPATIWRTYMGKVLEGRDPVSFPDADLDNLDEVASDQLVTVPDVRTETETNALLKLGKRRLIGEARGEHSSSPVGTVLWQSPAPGESADPGDTVYMGVSIGAAPPPPARPRDERRDDEDEEQDEDGGQGDDGDGGEGDGGGQGGGGEGEGGGDGGGEGGGEGEGGGGGDQDG